MELLLEQMESNSDMMWSAKRRAELDVWLVCICAFLNLNSRKEDKVCTTHLGRLLLITGMAYLRYCDHNGFEVLTACRNPSKFFLLTRKESSSLRLCARYHMFVYYSAAVKQTLASTLYMEVLIIIPLQVFFGRGYLPHGDTYWNKSRRWIYHVFFTTIDVQVKRAIAPAYGDFRTAELTTVAD